MANRANLLTGLLLIAETYPNPDDTECDIHNDTLYVGTSKGTPKKVAKQLEKLGWVEDEEAWSFTT